MPPGGSKGVYTRSSQVIESYEVGTHAFRGSVDYSFVTSASGSPTHNAPNGFTDATVWRAMIFRFVVLLGFTSLVFPWPDIPEDT